MNRHARRSVVVGCLVAVCGSVGLIAGLASAEKQPEEMDITSMDPNAIMEMMAEAAKPGEHHKLLHNMVGDWEMTSKFWMDPAAEPEVSKGWTSSKMMLGDRQLVGHVKMDFNFGGQVIPFEGVAMMGYDNLKGEYVSIWTDTMMTGYSNFIGKMDGDKLVTTGTNNTPMGEIKAKHVYSFNGPDSYTMEFYEPNPMTGEMMRTGLIEYTRSAKGGHDDHGHHDD